MALKKRPKLSKIDPQSILGGRISFKERKFKLSEKQQSVLSCLMDDKTRMVFVSGVAGSSKTWISVYAALNLLNRDYNYNIIYLRSIIESASKSLGYLPGSSEEKFSPFMIPLLEKCDEILDEESVKQLVASEKIVSMPINFLRGVDWKNKIVIVDESQNMTLSELRTILTRVGEGTKIFIVGDERQSDINGKSGFVDFIRAFDDEECRENGIFNFKFTEEDIVRSEILKLIVRKMETIPGLSKGH